MVLVDGVDALGSNGERTALVDLARQARDSREFTLVVCASTSSILDFLSLDGSLSVTDFELEESNA